MLGLSVVIAVMGLSTDSATLVIGAMLIAPLMTPILGLSAAITLTLGRHASRAAITVLLASAGAIGLAWGVSLLLPVSERTLTHEVLVRTSPDIRDLVIAFAAGAAGAYATVKEDISAALPGVAVAVALLPPLSAVGYALASSRPELAGGALLLFTANLFAVLLAGIGVFVATGLTPRRRLIQRSRWVLAGLAVLVAALAAVTVPLVNRTESAIRHAYRLQQINTAVSNWLDSTSGLAVTDVEVNGNLVTVDVSGPVQPPNSTELRKALVPYLGTSASVQVRWFQTNTKS